MYALVASTRRTLWTRPAHSPPKGQRMHAPRVQAAKGWPVQSHVATAPPGHTGCNGAVAPPLRRAVPPLLGLGQRRAQAAQDAPAAQGSLEVLEQRCPATSQPLLGAKAQGGAPCFTAEDNLSHCTKADYAQRTVKHGAGASA